MVNLKINGIEVTVEENTTVVEAAKAAGIHIPTLCYLKGINEIGACRVCLVEVKGARGLVPACVTRVSEGMEVLTNTKVVRDTRKSMVELILSDHNKKCLTCPRNTKCELQDLCAEVGIDSIPYRNQPRIEPVDEKSPSIVRDNSKCVMCRRCVSTCQNVQKTNAIGVENRGIDSRVKCAFGHSLADSNCINCGQCIIACPVGALYEKDGTKAVWRAIEDPKTHVVIQAAPAVRAALGEEFGLPIGTRVTGKMIAAMRALGVDKVFDTNFGADLTILEEGTEFIERVQNGGVLPMITSCSPGWIKYCEHHFPDLIPNLSSCKSPHEMFGAIIKTYYSKKSGIAPENLFVVSVMPCTAKKYERQRPEMENKDGIRDVDAVITTRELANMIKTAGIDFLSLENEGYDDMLGDHTGAAVIFGATGGVMEAALRTVVEVLTGKEAETIEYEAVRGIKNVKEATLMVGDMPVKVAVAHGTGGAKELLERVRRGEADYHFIEVMGCPGGCVTGGGQPKLTTEQLRECNPSILRAKALYEEDEAMTLRKSHENPSLQKLYKDFLEKPGSHIAHELLHTTYTPRGEHK